MWKVALLVVAVLAAASAAAQAQMQVNEPDGRPKLLYDNGRWHYAPEPGMEAETNRPGGDLTGFELLKPDPAMCAAACRGNAACQAWTFVKPGLQNVGARCWLKSAVPEPQASTCCISGLRSAGGATPGEQAGARTIPGEPDVIEGSAETSFSLRSRLGLPDAFTKMALPAEGGGLMEIEIWEYYDQRLAHLVIDGVPQDLIRLGEPPERRAGRVGLDPELLSLGMTPQQVASRIRWPAVDGDDERNGSFGLDIDDVTLEFEQGRLVFVDTGPQPEEGGRP